MSHLDVGERQSEQPRKEIQMYRLLKIVLVIVALACIAGCKRLHDLGTT